MTTIHFASSTTHTICNNNGKQTIKIVTAISQSEFSSVNQAILLSWCLISSILSTRRSLQCTLTKFLTCGHVCLLHFFGPMKLNVDHLHSHDPVEVTSGNIRRSLTNLSNSFNFVFFINKVNKARTSQLWLTDADVYITLVAL